MTTANITFGSGITIGSGITAGAAGGGGGPSLILSLLSSVGPSGNVLLDQSGNNNNFTWSGSNPWSVGNDWYDFSSAQATSNSTTLFDAITNQMTIFSWVKFPNGFSGSLSIIARDPSFALRVDNGSSVNLVKYNVADQRVSHSFNSTSIWFHICAIQGPTNVTYVVNGTSIGTYNNSSNFNSTGSPVFLGYDDYTGNAAPIRIGRLDMWNSARSVSDAQTAWNSQKSAYGY